MDTFPCIQNGLMCGQITLCLTSPLPSHHFLPLTSPDASAPRREVEEFDWGFIVESMGEKDEDDGPGVVLDRGGGCGGRRLDGSGETVSVDCEGGLVLEFGGGCGGRRFDGSGEADCEGCLVGVLD